MAHAVASTSASDPAAASRKPPAPFLPFVPGFTVTPPGLTQDPELRPLLQLMSEHSFYAVAHSDNCPLQHNIFLPSVRTHRRT